MTLSFTVPANELATQIKWVATGVSRTTTSHIRMEVDPQGVLELQCNTEVNSYQSKVDVTFIGDRPTRKRVFILDGEAFVKAPRILNKGDARFDIEDKGSNVTLSTERASFDIGIVTSQMPASSHVAQPVGQILAGVFGSAIKQVSKATSGALDRNLATLACISLEFQPSQSRILLTATDRFSLAQKIVEYTPHDKEAEDFQIIINGKTLTLAGTKIDQHGVINLFTESSGIRLGMSTNKQSVQLAVDKGEYPQYHSLLKTDTNAKFSVKKSDLSKGVNDVRELSQSPEITLKTNTDSGEATLSLVSPHTNIEIECETDDPHNEVTFNIEKLLTALGFLTSPVVEMNFPENKRKGIVLRELLDDGEVDESFFGLVIPMIMH